MNSADTQAIGYGDFLRGLFQNPKNVSALTPSSEILAQVIANEVDPEKPGLVVELGPGTGVVTRALCQTGIRGERIIAIEAGREFSALLQKRFPEVRVCQGDALAFEKHLPAGASIAAVVSGLPLLNFPPAARKKLIEKALACQTTAPRFIQLSYGWRPPVPAEELNCILRHRFVLQNFPPAHVWTYMRK